MISRYMMYDFVSLDAVNEHTNTKRPTKMPIKTRLVSRIGLIQFLLANLFGTLKCDLWFPWVDNEDSHLDILQFNSFMHVEPKNRLTFLAISNQ